MIKGGLGVEAAQLFSVKYLSTLNRGVWMVIHVEVNFCGMLFVVNFVDECGGQE
jgi:hypothetical protein